MKRPLCHPRGPTRKEDGVPEVGFGVRKGAEGRRGRGEKQTEANRSGASEIKGPVNTSAGGRCGKMPLKSPQSSGPWPEMAGVLYSQLKPFLPSPKGHHGKKHDL